MEKARAREPLPAADDNDDGGRVAWSSCEERQQAATAAATTATATATVFHPSIHHYTAAAHGTNVRVGASEQQPNLKRKS
ncbi:hypothetical protein AND_009760 [Anopheles darlingi]|uniref:Uncharacterized protein n=1 Tax=Anopheles darlingi TaxID=43151 RepID=W5J322_ANODA|nr:hypothetical protein AND_009760 [Anopheles darlingi]